MNELRKRLNILLKENNTKQKELAEFLQITRQAVSTYQDGSSQPTAAGLLKIANYFNVSTDYLLGNSEVRTTNTTIKDICEYTGLSQEIVEKLHNAEDTKRQMVSKIIYVIID